jgi:signal transduction histidine kinase
MADAPRPADRADPADDRAMATDAAMVRGVRWRLVLWSGLSTLVVLLILGAALYVGVAQTLEQNGMRQLIGRADEIADLLENPRGRPGPDYGFRFGGDASGTYAMLVNRNGRLLVRAQNPPPGLPDRPSVDGAADHGRDVRLATVESVPLRILTERVPTRAGDVFVQVVGDRTAEQQTLTVLVGILLVGGLVVVLVAFGLGTVYARRALVPIRRSLTSQRAALRRQREFAADASHELRTPLTVIRSSVDHLRRHGQRPVVAMTDAVDDIDAEVDHLTSLVDDLLLLARSDSGAITLARQPLDLGDVAAEAAAALVAPAGSRRVSISVDPEPAIVSGDAERLRQLAVILVDNAVRHSPAGGEVRVRVRAANGRAELEVADDGPGIKAEDLPRVFERFWRAPGAPSGGTGLGLAIANSIVNLHGGRITVTSAPGAGTRFSVALPLASDGPRPAGPADPAAYQMSPTVNPSGKGSEGSTP